MLFSFLSSLSNPSELIWPTALSRKTEFYSARSEMASLNQVLRSSGIAWEAENIPQRSSTILMLLRKRGYKRTLPWFCILNSKSLLQKGFSLQSFKKPTDRELDNRQLCYLHSSRMFSTCLCTLLRRRPCKNQPSNLHFQASCKANSKISRKHIPTCQSQET